MIKYRMNQGMSNHPGVNRLKKREEACRWLTGPVNKRSVAGFLAR
jgi:hypothetical protein